MIPIRASLIAVSTLLLSGTRKSPASGWTRRQFVRNMVLGGVGLAGLQIAGSAVAFAWPLRTSAFGTPIPVSDSQVPGPGEPPFRHQAGRFYLINNEEGLLALYWKCPHLGCTVPWVDEADSFHCPCHASHYNRHGELVSGPAPRPMDLMEITRDEGGALIVDTGDIRQRSSFEPEQAFRLDS